MDNIGGEDFLVKPELGDESGVEAEASGVVVLSLALKGQQKLQWGSPVEICSVFQASHCLRLVDPEEEVEKFPELVCGVLGPVFGECLQHHKERIDGNRRDEFL